MDQQVISTSGAPEILIENIDGSLQVKGWEHSEINVKANADELDLQEQEDTVRLSCHGNCELRVPYGAALQVGEVHGDAHFKLLEDQLTLQQVHGSLVLSNLAETQVNRVDGNLTAKQIAGDLRIGRVEGNAAVRAVQGDLEVEHVEGNLEVRAVEGEVRAAASGNAHLRLSQLTGSDYSVEAEGNIFCRIPEDASVRMTIKSSGQVIRIKSPQGVRNLRQESGEFTLGDGEVNLSLSAGGVVQVDAKETLDDAEEGPESGAGAAGWPPQFNDQVGRQIESQINAQMEAISQQLNEQMSSLSAMIDQAGLSPEQSDRIMQQARESSERATVKAQEKMRRAQEKLERKLEAARRREELHAQAAERRAQSRGRKSWSFEWPAAPTPPRPPAPPEPAQVSDEERLMILRMLEQKKITLEEAEQLLAALEGKEG